MSDRQTAILVLAAGESKRMGVAKQLLPYRGTTLLGHCLQTALSTHIGKVYCVLGAHFSKTIAVVQNFPAVQLVHNEDWQLGMGSSISVGVKSILSDIPEVGHVLIMLADQPFMNVAYLAKMFEAAVEEEGIVVATKYADAPGVPAIFPSAVFEKLSGLNGESGAKKLIMSYPKVVSVTRGDRYLLDVDTEDDYQIIIG